MENNFTNEIIDTSQLPKFEEVKLTPLKPSYWKVIFFNISLTFIIIGAFLALMIYFVEDFPFETYAVVSIYIFLLLLTFTIARVSFKNKGYTFREHDVIYRSGAIAVTTTIIPYNRIQHAALHEGFIARKLGLASIEFFTAGGANSDLRIPGMEKQEAENIKQLFIGKIISEKPDNE